MPILRRWKYREGVFAIWHLTETTEELKSCLEGYEYIDSELKVYKSESRKLEYLAVRVLLNEMTGKRYKILHHSSGKPYLDGYDFNISISHTKGYVAIGLHSHCELGIDIEYLSDRVKKISSRFVRDDENEYLLCNPKYSFSESDYINKLLLIWSAKETLFKIMNLSEVDFRNHLRIYPFDLDMYGLSGEMKAQEYKSDIQSVFKVNYIINEDFVCTYSVAD